MTRSLRIKLSIDDVWFGILMLYVMAGYLANNVLLPTAITQLTLYGFLAFSMFLILLRGRIKLNTILVWGLLCLGLALFSMLYGPEFTIFGGAYYAMIVNFILIFICHFYCLY